MHKQEELTLMGQFFLVAMAQFAIVKSENWTTASVQTLPWTDVSSKPLSEQNTCKFFEFSISLHKPSSKLFGSKSSSNFMTI
jgi:hypothetical protein